MDIPTREEWQNLPGKSARKEALINLRRNFSDKEIREAWGLKPANWYQMVSRYTKGDDTAKRGPGRPKGSTKPDEIEEPRKREFQELDGGEVDLSKGVPNDRHWPRKNVVDAEFQVLGGYEEKVSLQEIFAEKKKEPEPEPPADVQLPFPTIKGTPAQLRKQFEGISLFLEGLEGEDARFEIRISAVKA